MARIKIIRIALWAMVALAFLLLGLLAYGHFRPQSDGFALAHYGTSFKLISSRGGVFDSNALRGRPYGIFFGFTHCPEVCPTTLSDMSAALQELGDQARDYRLIFITVDPERDTVAVMKDYLANFDPRIEGLVPNPDQLAQVARGYHVYYKKQRTSDGDYTMDHTATLFLIDARGTLKSTIAFDDNRTVKIEKLKKLLSAQ